MGAVQSRKLTARSANALIRTPKVLRAVKNPTKAMATVMTTTTTKVVSTTAVIVVRRVWAVRSRRLTARSANALILIPKDLRAVRKTTKAMATAMTITTTK